MRNAVITAVMVLGFTVQGRGQERLSEVIIF